MEPPKKAILKKTQPPQVPIKTYKWEDIRRERLKGSYPWTYLNRDHFDTDEDYNKYKIMEAKADIAAPVIEGAATKYVVITDLPTDLERDPTPRKILPEEELNLELDEGEPEVLFTVESAESSDNISQYLDKEENEAAMSTEIARARSEEPPLKRKLSIESGYSRKSLSRLGIIKKLKATKEKIMHFSKKEPKPQVAAPKPETKKGLPPPRAHPDPVYIHIPLKPPEGEPEPKREGEEKVATNQERRFSEGPEIVAVEIMKTESIDFDDASKAGIAIPEEDNGDIFIVHRDRQSSSGDVMIIMPDREDTNLLKVDTRSQRSLKSQKSIRSTKSQKSVRAKSAEPEPKRRSSIDSSHSRKSLSKLTKTFKDVKNSLVATFSKAPSTKSLTTTPKEAPKKLEPLKLAAKNSKEPKYIHIPLKPPPGQSDEYSHLSNEPTAVLPPTGDKEEGEVSPQDDRVQFIFLTPPSDDEILDSPEPVENEPAKFELKQIAVGAIERVSPERTLDNEADNVLIDEEDGLKSRKTTKESDQELKSSLKTDSPVLKKKVSFKRRSRDDSKDDGIYEVVQSPDLATPKPEDVVVDTSQSMSVDEEKSYVDDSLASTLDEDYNKWSTLSDHVYEPINPPADVAPARIAVEECMEPVEEPPTDQPPIEEPPIKEQIPLPLVHKAPSVEKQPTTEETAPPGPTFKQSLKDQAEKFKTKLGGIKRPNIRLPPRPKIGKPNLDWLKVEAPTFHMPKMPTAPKIHMPSFTLPHRNSKRALKQRQFSTESNAGEPKTNYFKFSTYPRMFKKKTKPKYDSGSSFSSKSDPAPEEPKQRNHKKNDRFGGKDTIRIPLHAEEEPPLPEEEAPKEDSYEEEYEKENQEIHQVSKFSHDFNSRWNHGSFHPEVGEQVTDLDVPEPVKETYSSESSLGIHRRGVLEEIDSDEFFLRQKGISQDNIEVGAYLSSEIREAFKPSGNTLSDLSFAARASNQSLPETQPKRKSVKKPKRKKTPHVSQEQVFYAEDSDQEMEDLLPLRPRRKSKRSKKKEAAVVPYQETIQVETRDDGFNVTHSLNEYENECNEELNGEVPLVPPRRDRSLKNIDSLDQESILGTYLEDEPKLERHIQQEYESSIRSLSKSSLKSAGSSLEEEEAPIRPPRTRSRSRAASFSSQPSCIEEPCTQQRLDCMGYATIAKNRREPPLPPSRRRSTSSDHKFATVPRISSQPPPTRPLRNYSILGPSRPPRKKNMTDEEKHHESQVDISQYIEIEETNRHLQSGPIVQKMKDRPLPAPPRPPRKSRTSSLETESNVAEVEERPEALLLAPTRYSYEEETVTHGSLVVQPLNGASILPESELTQAEVSRETRVPVVLDYDDEDSQIPAEFAQLKDSLGEAPPVRARTLQVDDLDVNRLNVSELIASKMIVSEIECGSIQCNEVGKLGELPPSVVEELFSRLESLMEASKSGDAGQKKTPIESDLPPNVAISGPESREASTLGDEVAPPRPPRPLGFFEAEGGAPKPPRRRRRRQEATPSSSDDEEGCFVPVRRRVRSPEPSIPQLSGQLVRACGALADGAVKRLMTKITNGVLQGSDGRLDLHVVLVMLLVLIAGLILLGFGNGKVVHHHHWEYFNPPRDL